MNQAEKLRDKNYYLQAKKGSLNLNHPAMLILKAYLKTAKTVIDLGCGEGTRLASLLSGKANSGIGVDNNQKAINSAKKSYPKLNFLKASLVKLPFKNQTFDLAYSAYVFEHLENPEKVILESNRILKNGGIWAVVAPNFGAPNRHSPNSLENKYLKLIHGFSRDLFRGSSSSHSLGWTKVSPLKKIYDIDGDTVIEPYLGSLISYLENSEQWLIKEKTSCWSQDRWSFFQIVFRLLGCLGIYPFKYWGPHLCLVAQKITKYE